MDTMTPEQRHRCMAAIKAKNTKPELIVRRYLHARGFRFRLNHKRLPGHPDLVLRKYRTCIFVNGCFWHGHGTTVEGGELLETSLQPPTSITQQPTCSFFKLPKSRTDYWRDKIIRNKTRDVKTQKQLAAMGWHTITVWECELKPARRQETLESLAFTLNRIFLKDHEERYSDVMELDNDRSMAAEEWNER